MTSSFLVEDKKKLVKIEDVVLHPNYTGLAYNDTAVIKLKHGKLKVYLNYSPMFQDEIRAFFKLLFSKRTISSFYCKSDKRTNL